MKIVVLGGTGIIGRWVVRDLFDSSDAEIVIAATELRKAEKFVRSFQSKRVTAVSVDVRNVAATARVIKNADVVVNCVNYYFNLHVMRACLSAGVHYIDLGGLFHVTKKQLTLHNQFKRKGLLAILGCGSTPGITNVLAAYGARSFDRVDEVHISFGDKDFTKYEQPFVLPYTLQTLFDEYMLKPAVLMKKKMKLVEPLSDKATVDFPLPVGKQHGFYTLHSELATLPASFHLKECSFRATFDRQFTEQLQFLIRVGFASKNALHVDGADVIPRNFTAKLMEQWLPKKGTKINDMELLRVELCGKKKGRSAGKVMYCATRSRYNIPAGTYDTAVPASVIAQMVAHGQIKTKGVLPPERCVPVELFFKELKKRGMKIFTRKV